MLYFLYYLEVVIMVAISVAFFTLMERRVLGLSQIRMGPFVVGFMGLMQPVSDAFSLFTSGWLAVESAFSFFWGFGPFMGILMFFLSWALYPWGSTMVYLEWGFMYLICIIGLGVYFPLVLGFFSGSSYALLGSYRVIVQMISYDVILIFSILCMLSVSWSVDLSSYLGGGWGTANIWLMVLPLVLIWLVSCLAESNRTPYDFLEGESELVSGFNVEYWGGYFSFIFIYEYGFILLVCMLTSVVFFGGLLSVLMFGFFLYFFLWVRLTFPRFRYDGLMFLAWKVLLMLVLSLFCLVSVI